MFSLKIGPGENVNEVLAPESYQPVIVRFKKRKVYLSFKDYIWVTDFVKIGSSPSKNWGFKNLLCSIDVFSKCAWAKPLKLKKAKTILNVFIRIVNEYIHKPNKLRVNKGRKFYNSFMQKWLDDNVILMYSTHNDGKLIVAEKFIKNWQLIISNLILVVWIS